MIHIENVSKYFKDYQALKSISFSVNPGEIFGFIGRNGAGKSTTMNIMCGLSKLDSGSCLINDLDVRKVAHPSDLKIGYLPENPTFYGWLNAYETLEYLSKDISIKDKKDRIRYLVEWVGLTHAAKRRVGGYSRGMKQRLGIAASLIHNPDVLIFDEPSSALDPEGRNDVMRLLIDLKKQGKTIILSTHILNDIERICDRIAIIEQGQIVLEDSLDNLLDKHTEPIIDIDFELLNDENLIDTLKALKGVNTVTQEGMQVHVYIDHKSVMQDVLKHLASVDATVSKIALRKSTLEDLFLKEVERFEG
jgi:ABC-2 type transport system ATP-binding protein